MWKRKVVSKAGICYKKALDTLKGLCPDDVSPRSGSSVLKVTTLELTPKRMAVIFFQTQIIVVDGVELYTIEYILDQPDEWILSFLDNLGWGGCLVVDEVTVELLWYLFVTSETSSVHSTEVTRYLITLPPRTLAQLLKAAWDYPDGGARTLPALIYMAVTGYLLHTSPSDLPLNSLLRSTPIIKQAPRCALRVHLFPEAEVGTQSSLEERGPITDLTPPLNILTEEQNTLKDWLVLTLMDYTSGQTTEGLYTNNIPDLAESLGMLFPLSISTIPLKTAYFFANLLAYTGTFDRSPQEDPLPPFRKLSPKEYHRYSDLDLLHLFGFPPTPWCSRPDLVRLLQGCEYRPGLVPQ